MGRRSKVVWASLVGGMTAVTSLLLVLDRDAPTRLDGFTFPVMATTTGSTSIEAVFETRTPVEPGRWQAIVIDHTGSSYGTPASIDEKHKSLGLNGLGSDFVIGNGKGMAAGEIHVGERWLEQKAGAHTAGPDGRWYNTHAIGITLVGDGNRRGFSDAQMSRLLDLVTALAREYDIPPEQIVLHSDVAAVAGPGRYFPAAALREQVDSSR
jgi:hypothetical protein